MTQGAEKGVATVKCAAETPPVPSCFSCAMQLSPIEKRSELYLDDGWVMQLAFVEYPIGKRP